MLRFCLGYLPAQRSSSSSAWQKTVTIFVSTSTVATLLCAALLITTYACQLTFHAAGCRKSEFLATNRTLLPLNNIVALNFILNQMYPLVGFVDQSKNIWCSSFPGSNNHVNMTFTEPVVVEAITSHGEFNEGFVSNFSVFVSPSLDSDKKLELLDEVC